MSDIPSYYEVYRHPHPHHPPRPMPSHVDTTSKSVNIADAFGNLRYIVELVSYPFYNEATGAKDLGFKVIVKNIIENTYGVPFLMIPEGQAWEFEYEIAMKNFKDCVDRYNSLVAAEMKDFKDIDIYKDRIKYVETKPCCCMFCRWCTQVFLDDHCRQRKLECRNPRNQQKFTYTNDIPSFPSGCMPVGCRHGHPHHQGWQKLPWQKDVPPPYDNRCPPGPHLPPIYPVVDQFGRCENFERAEHCSIPCIIDGCVFDSFLRLEDGSCVQNEDAAPPFPPAPPPDPRCNGCSHCR